MAPRSGLHYETMSADLTNLLPQYRKRFLTRDYLFRLGVVAVWLAIFLVLIHGLLLLPSYLYVNGQIRSQEEQLITLEAAGGSANEQEVKARIAALETRAKQLAGLASQPTASGAIGAILIAPRPGVTLHGFTYAPAATADAHKMTLVGVANNRESLRQYLAVLDALAFVTKAELPISAYAKERDIDFTITLIGTLRP